MSKDEHNKIAKVENLIWEIAQTLQPNLLIESEKIEKAKKDLLKIFNY
tara:strand:+ start:14 stop:157 length:144 start_codon:yes stop_codon:yes gene_type:complete